jgi:uncharacterized lipoprotein YmbA
MKRSHHRLETAAFLLVVVALLTGCGTSAPTKFYTLSAAAPGDFALAAHTPGTSRMVVGVGTVDIPDYLDRPQIVTRTSRHQLVLSECDLWGGSLKADVNRVLLENLGRILPPDRFQVVAIKRGVPVDYRVAVTITRFDTVPEDGAVLHAQWALSGKDGKCDGSFRTTRLTERVMTGDIDGSVAAMSRALAKLSTEIAAQIETTVP